MDSRDDLIEALRQVVARQAAQISQLADRLAQVDGSLQFLDRRSVDGRRLAGAGLARLLSQALHGDDLRIAGQRLRRIDRGDSQANATR